MKHIFYGFIASVTSLITASHLLQVVPLSNIQQLINALVAIVSGILTGLLSKWLSHFFINAQTQKNLTNAQQQVTDLQSQIQKLSQQALDTNQAQTK